MRLHRILLLMILLGLVLIFPARAQDVNNLVEMRVEAGYESCFREDFWLPLRINVRNSGDEIIGRLIVRPETSGRVVSNAYSTPIDLPSGSEKTATLYIQARSFPPEVTVELLDAGNARVLQQGIGLTHVETRDEIHVVITGSTGSGIPLNGVHAAERAACQARWSIDNLPDNAKALQAVDTMWLINADTSSLSTGQRTALEGWVLEGGHLVVTGGPDWQGTASGLPDFLPFIPENSQSIEDLSALATFAGMSDALTERTVVATGEVRAGAVVLAATEDDLPLLVRQAYGNGTVDYLTANPTLAPLVDWEGSDELWFTMISTGYPRPFWTQGYLDKQNAATAMAILPGIELLPPVSSMVIFLFAYILLIGPVNYYLLNRLNRRGLAWVTIPLCIVIFSVLAWTVGFNLRGSDVTVSRISIIRTWNDSETAEIDSLISILAPRRGTYSMQLPEGRVMHVLPTLSQGGLLLTNAAQSTAEIVQTTQFTAEEFSVDGGIFANFSASGATIRPAINGTFTLTYNADGTESLQGAIRNDSEITLQNPVLLARGMVYRLNKPVAPGDLITLNPSDLILTQEKAQAAPAPLELAYERLSSLRETRDIRLSNNQTINGILGDLPESAQGSYNGQQQNRLVALLTAFLSDQYGSTGYGDTVYLAGWSDTLDRDVTLAPGDLTYISVDTTLYLMEMDVQPELPPAGETVTVQPNRFTWVSLLRQSVEGPGPNDMTLLPDAEIVLRYTPLPDAKLADVSEMTVFVDRSSGYGGRVNTFLWNYQTRQWEAVQDSREDTYTFANPDAYLDTHNSVMVRLTLDIEFGSAWIRRVSVSQTGTY